MPRIAKDIGKFNGGFRREIAVPPAKPAAQIAPCGQDVIGKCSRDAAFQPLA